MLELLLEPSSPGILFSVYQPISIFSYLVDSFEILKGESRIPTTASIA